MSLYITVLILVCMIVYTTRYYLLKERSEPFITPKKWKVILHEKVFFYQRLDQSQKERFEQDVFHFLKTIKVTGAKGAEVTLEDRLLVASSAVIPLFGFPQWHYTYLDEVILYPSAFDLNFNLRNPDQIVTGLVGSGGAMEGKMILSKPALHYGFDVNNDKKNVAIHEFVHLFDKEDGYIDGIPPGFDGKEFTLPWVELMRKKTLEIVAKDSDINKYASTNQQEFFAVASEYFFERPSLLKKKHPELYTSLSHIFQQDTAGLINSSAFTKKARVSRNGDCPCGSGEKYKSCCLN